MTTNRLRQYDDLSYVEKLSLIDFSYSRLSTYEYCPAQYFYSYIYKAPRGFAEHAVLGNVIHKVMEIIAGTAPSQDEVESLYQDARDEFDPEELISEHLIEAGIQMIFEYLSRHEDEMVTAPPNIIGREKEFQFVLDNLLFRGYIDRIDQIDPETIWICDWKSGKNQVAQKWVHNNAQLGIYFLACSLMYPEVKTVRASMYYLRSGKQISYTYTHEKDFDRVLDLVTQAVAVVRGDQYFHYTSNERRCTWCDHNKSKICSVGVKRSYKR